MQGREEVDADLDRHRRVQGRVQAGCHAGDQQFWRVPMDRVLVSFIEIWHKVRCLLAEREGQRAELERQLAETNKEIAKLQSDTLAGVFYRE